MKVSKERILNRFITSVELHGSDGTCLQCCLSRKQILSFYTEEYSILEEKL